MDNQFKVKEKKLKTSDDKQVILKVTLFTGSYGIEVLTKILSKTAPALLSAIDTKNKNISDIDIDFKEVSNNIMSGLLDGSMLDLIKEIVSTSFIDNLDLKQESLFDMAFSGEYGLLIDTITFVLEANYKSFLLGNVTKIVTKKLKTVLGDLKGVFTK